MAVAELEELRTLLEQSDRARKHAEGELDDAGRRVNELTIQVDSP